jgi:hypothetical protein
MLSRYPVATRPGSLTARQARAVDRHLNAVQTGVGLELADVNAVEVVEIAKIDALRGIGKAALGAVDDMAADARFRAEHNPTATASLCFITGKIDMAIGERIERATRRLG